MSEDLYHPFILKHNNNPANFVKRSDAQYRVVAYNPVCGDQFVFYFDLIRDEVNEITFSGYGCAVSKAVCSVLTDILKTQNKTEAIEILENYLELMTNDKDIETIHDALKIFVVAKSYPARLKCATLGAEAMLEKLLDIKS